jgi:hypothetical protein
MTSLKSATTHIIPLRRDELAQMRHTSSSLMLLQRIQYFISDRSRPTAFDKSRDTSASLRSRNKAKRNADLRPIPGSRDNAMTASSNNFEGYSTVQKYYLASIIRFILLWIHFF